MTRYFDASALAKRYVHETRSQQMGRLLSESHCATSRCTEVEVASALARRTREGTLTIRERDRALGALQQDIAAFYVVEMSSDVTAQAIELLTQYRLRGPDAIQLASTLYLQKHLHDTLELVAFDQQLVEIAVLEGLKVWSAKR
ncbi:type II toxin-antitoxin system VapC family toxin [Nitrospira sp. M1]